VPLIRELPIARRSVHTGIVDIEKLKRELTIEAVQGAALLDVIDSQSEQAVQKMEEKTEILGAPQNVQERDVHDMSSLPEVLRSGVRSLPVGPSNESRESTSEGGGVEKKVRTPQDGHINRERGRIQDGTSLGKRGRIQDGTSPGKRGRIQDGTSPGKRGRIQDGTSLGKRGRIQDGTSLGKRGRIQDGTSPGKRGHIEVSGTSHGKGSIVSRFAFV